MKHTEHKREKNSPQISSPTPQISSKEFIYQVIQNIGPDIKDINFLSIVLKSIEKSLEAILCKYISVDKCSKSIKTTVTNHFVFCEEDILQILEAIDANLSLYTANGTLKEEVCNLFRTDKRPLLQQVISGNLSWSIAGDLPTYIIAYNTRHKSKDPSCIHTFITNHLFKSAEFKVMLGYICECILSPSTSILNLSIILSCKDFRSGMSNQDFKRATHEMLTDMIGTTSQLSEKGIKFLTYKLFAKHKYLFCSEYLESGTFTEVVQSLTISLQDLDKTCEKDVIEKAIESLSEPFTKIEIAVIKKYLARMELGLVKFAMTGISNSTLDIEMEDLLDIILTKLRTDLLSKTPPEQAPEISLNRKSPRKLGDADKARILQTTTTTCTNIDLGVLNPNPIHLCNTDANQKRRIRKNSLSLDLNYSRAPNIALHSFTAINNTTPRSTQSNRESIRSHHRTVEEKWVDVSNTSLSTASIERLRRSPRSKIGSDHVSNASTSVEPRTNIILAIPSSILDDEAISSIPKREANATTGPSIHPLSKPKTIPTHRSRVTTKHKSATSTADRARVLHLSTSLPEISYKEKVHSPIYEKRTLRKRTSSYESTILANSKSTTNSTTSESEVATSSESTQDVGYKDLSKSLSRTSEEKQQNSPSDTFANLASSSLPITISPPISIINLVESSTKQVKEPLAALESKSTYLDIAKTI